MSEEDGGLEKLLQDLSSNSEKRSPGDDKTSTGGGSNRESSDHEMHILTERQRRKKMRIMFANLHALLPHLPPKVDKSTVVDEAVSYIKTLQHTLQKLQKQKLERLQQEAAATPIIKPTHDHHHPAVQFHTWTSSNVVLNICGGGAQLSVCAPKKAGLFTAICCVLEKHNIEVLSAHVSSDASRCMYMIQAHHQALWEGHSELEEVYKQAAREIMCWVTS